MMRTHKRKKATRYHGRNMGTSGHGSRKTHRSSGNRGGIGMSGTGKRADHKKTLINKLYGNDYFGKQGITSKKTQKDKRQRIDLKQIQNNLESYGKKTSKGWEINLENYKILGKLDIKEKLIITAFEASKGAIESIKKLGGEITLKEKKKIITPLVEHHKKKTK
jgi:large subunit ribosomal protein L15